MNELTIYQLFKSLKKASLRILLVGCLFAVASFGVLALFPSYYGFTALVQVANTGSVVNSTNDPSGGTLAKLGSAMMDGPSTKKEVISYLNFKYIDPKDASLAPAYLRKVEEAKNADMIILTIYGQNLKLAHEFADKVLLDIREKYDPKIQDFKQDATRNLSIYESQVKTLTESIETNKAALQALGFTATLVQQRSELEFALLRTQTYVNALKSAISSEKLFNFYFQHAYDLDSDPVYPATLLLTVLMFFVGCFVMVVFEFIKEEDARINSASNASQSLAKAPAPLRSVQSSSLPKVLQQNKAQPRFNSRFSA